MTITAEQVRLRLDYDESTGALTWKKNDGASIQWNARFAGNRAGGPTCNGYRQINFDHEVHRQHRLIWLWVHGRWPEGQIDHVNGDRSDNRLANLRECTNAENARNKKPKMGGSSDLKGVSFHRASGRWRAAITHDYRSIYLGLFSTPEAAHAAYCAAALRLQGEFARAA